MKPGPGVNAPDSLTFKNNWFLTGDYSVGGIGLRGLGVNGMATGNITLSGVPANADIIAAYLYWETLGNGQNGVFTPQGAPQSNNIVGTALGTVPSPCWPQPTITVYRADVLQYFPRDDNGRQLVNGSHVISLPDSGLDATGRPTGTPSTEGVTLVIVWRLPGMPYKAIVLYDGAFTVPANGNFNLTGLGFFQASSVNPQARMTHIVGDGQGPSPAPNVLNINGVLYNSPFTSALGHYWDNFTVSATVAGNASQVTTSSSMVTDCITWGAVVFSTTVQDTDGDGIPDIVETSGMTDPADGSFINFPAMGANPNVKDLFVQLDWMVAADHNHQPKSGALNKVISGFAAAPGGAVNVHFDTGQGGQFTGGGHQIPEVTPTAWKKDLNAFKAVNFANNRRNFWRYGLLAHSQVGTTSSGISDLPGGDFMITFGGWTHPDPADNMVGTEDEQTGTIMHEMGHGFNLKHGGSDHTPNCKPDYESVMNYSFQVTGLMDAAGNIHWDYSRQAMPSINESLLSESAGLGTMTYRTRWFAPPNPIDLILGDTRTTGCTQSLAYTVVRKDSTGTGAPLNWNNNITFSAQPPYFVSLIDAGTVAVDLNGSGAVDASSYPGYNDWASADFQQTNGRVNQANGELANGELANGELGNGELANGELANGSDPEIQYEFASQQNPPAPAGLTARVSPGQIRLAWTPVQLKIIAQYNIYRFDPNNAQTTITKIGQTTGAPPPAAFTDTQVVPGTRYGYFVTSTDSFVPPNQSSYSNAVAVTAQ
ncbi:MAG: hypothetical protein C5B51_23290 [Terriglobia bacterium]|nr:MAG: hypothetical protein C5B51_23290 [Terriglobia bacterium]